jgi:NADP-dependent 3-hydroxy acid dehydrogenase YdfG
MTPLRAEDLAEAVRWIASLPSHVNIDQMVVRPRDQATALQVHRVAQS